MDASNLDFPDGAFDSVVSHFAFHEVDAGANKRAVLKEALRVLKKGGHFAFQDYFLEPRYFGDPDALVETIHSWGITEVNIAPTKDLLHVPWLMRSRRSLGRTAVLWGRK